MTTPDTQRFAAQGPENAYQGTVRPLGTSVAIVAMRAMQAASAEQHSTTSHSRPATEASAQVHVGTTQPSVQPETGRDLYGRDLPQPSKKKVLSMGGLCL